MKPSSLGFALLLTLTLLTDLSEFVANYICVIYFFLNTCYGPYGILMKDGINFMAKDRNSLRWLLIIYSDYSAIYASFLK